MSTQAQTAMCARTGGENRGVAAIENGPAERGLRGVQVRWQCHHGKRPRVWGGIARLRSTLGELRSTQDRKRRQHADRQVLPRVNILRSTLLRGQHTREVFNVGENLARGRGQGFQWRDGFWRTNDGEGGCRMRASGGDGMTANGRGVRQVDEEGMDEHPGELIRGDGEFARTVGWIRRGEEGSQMSNVWWEKGGFRG